MCFADLSDQEVYENVTGIAKYRMKLPPGVPQNIATLIEACWNERPKKRLSFKQLHKRLGLIQLR